MLIVCDDWNFEGDAYNVYVMFLLSNVATLINMLCTIIVSLATVIRLMGVTMINQ